MTITARLQQLDPGLLIHSESKWTGSSNADKYGAFNDGGVECEVGEFLYSLIRVLKPQNVLETGTHFGVGASYMGMALHDNGFGHLDTIEFLSHIFSVGSKRIERIGLQNAVGCVFGDVAMFQPPCNYQLILLDTEPNLRFGELLKFYPYLDEGGYVFIHDTPRGLCQGNINPDHPNEPSWPFGNLPRELVDLVKQDKLRPFHLPSPRGLIGFYRVAEGDYKWSGQ